jgi:hypothetical protein
VAHRVTVWGETPNRSATSRRERSSERELSELGALCRVVISCALTPVDTPGVLMQMHRFWQETRRVRSGAID